MSGNWCCCSTKDPCTNCSSGFAPNVLKLVIPSGTFLSETTETGIDGDGDPIYSDNCPDDGCDFYSGTFFFDATPDCASIAAEHDSIANPYCCCYSICFGSDDRDTCPECQEQSEDCPAFCTMSICISAPGFALLQFTPDSEDNYTLGVLVGALSHDNTVTDDPPCGSCDFKSTGDALGSFFEANLGPDKPDCTTFDSVVCDLIFAPDPSLGYDGSYIDCYAQAGSTVEVSFVS